MGLFGGGSGADWLIAGLGNPEPKYDGTRHNTGFAALDALAEAWGCEINKSKWQGLYGIAQVDGRKVMLLKPLTYMNLSGKAVSYWLKAEKIPQENLLVVVDDIALPFGAIRIRAKGSDGGHNGLKSIAELLGNSDYARLRFGIGGDFPKGFQVDYVLGEWTPDERAALPGRIGTAAEAVLSFGTAGLERTMNGFNSK